jgi:hypothetical protein
VTADQARSTKDLHTYLLLFFSRVGNSLDSELWRSGDVDVVQQIPQYVSGEHGFIYSGLDLIGILIHLLLLGITQGSVVLIIFVFILVPFFFILMVVVMVVILWQLLSFLRVFSHRYCDHDLKGILLLQNILRRVGLQLLLRWHIPWHHLTSRPTSIALMGSVTRTNHLKFGNRR